MKKLPLAFIGFAVLFIGLFYVWIHFSKKPSVRSAVDLNEQLNWQLTAKEITDICDKERDKLRHSIELIESQGPANATFASSALALETALAEFQLKNNPMSFYKYMASSEDLRKAGDECGTKAAKLMVDLFLREELFIMIKSAKEKKAPLNEDDQFLLDEYYNDFRRNGLELSVDKRKTLEEKQKELVDLSAEFETRLAEWKNPSEFTRAELDGLSEDFLNSLEKSKTDPNKVIVTLAYPHYFSIIDNAKNPEVRRKISKKFQERGGTKNREIMQKAIKLKTEMAHILGYKTHAAFVLEEKMAKTPEAVLEFLEELKKKLVPISARDLDELRALKKAEHGEAAGKELNTYDWRYYANQLKKQKYDVDQDKIKEYFPLNTVLAGMFDIYQTLLNVQFVEIPKQVSWHPMVKAYSVVSPATSQKIATFYMDLFPREGKYGHAAAFTLIVGRERPDGTYIAPVSSIVANFSASEGDRPALLTHEEVRTLLHEFGHIMHQVLSTAKYARFSGTNVKGDFVEAPSQMLENWAWKPESLKKLSSHYKTGKPLPPDLINKLIAAKRASRGIAYTRQLFIATIDMNYHNRESTETFDTTKVWHDLTEEMCLLKSQRETYPEASMGHFMGGYDAGYYGYLWSEVFAAEMFARFERDGLFNPATGQDYLEHILQPGGAKNPYKLIEIFLGRAPNQVAFLKDFESNPTVN